MSDVRALLKAKRQEARIVHPYASYSNSGQLRCSVCSTMIKHASAWEGHLGSKLHRTNVAHLREEEMRQIQQVNELDDIGELSTKRKAVSDETPLPPEKRRRTENPSQRIQSLPQDFFSDSSQAPIFSSHDSDEELGDDPGVNSSAQASVALDGSSNVDAEYERFQREVLSLDSDPSELYNRATITAEALPASTDIPGFPPSGTETASQEPSRLTDEEARSKQELEERELIMDRLLAEERAQEDADTRVRLLKTKLETLRSKRQAAKAHKKHSD